MTPENELRTMLWIISALTVAITAAGIALSRYGNTPLARISYTPPPPAAFFDDRYGDWICYQELDFCGPKLERIR